MKRPLCVISAGFAIAIAVAFSFSVRQNLLLSMAVVATAMLLYFLKGDTLRVVMVFLLSAGIGLGYSGFFQMQTTLPFEATLGEEVVVIGLVTEVSQGNGQAYRYTVKAEFPDKNLPKGTIVIRAYGESYFREGEELQCRIKLQEPTYDSTKIYYKRNGIVAEGYFLEGEVIPSSGKYLLDQGLIALRQSLSKNLYRNLPTETANLVSAMVIGDTANLSSEIYSSLNRSGTSHLVSVSGLHLSILLGAIGALLDKCKLSKRLQAPILFLTALSFTLLVGARAPIVRALVMHSIMLLGQAIKKEADALSSLGFAGLLIAIFRPYWILSMGMWLSFFSTAGIVVLGSELSKKWIEKFQRDSKWYNGLVKGLLGSAGITVGAYLFTLPILVFGTGWLSIISPLANILVSPFSVLITVGGILTAILPQAFFLTPIVGGVVHFSGKMIVEISNLLAKLPFAIYSIDYGYKLITLVMVVGIGLLAFRFREKKKIVSCAVCISILLLGGSSLGYRVLNKNAIELVTLEDCNTAILLRGNHGVLLGNPSRYEVSKVINYLNFRSITVIDAIVVPDHGEQIGSSLGKLADSFTINSIIGPDDSYILEQLAQSLEGIPVYASGYATVNVLGTVSISFSLNASDIYLAIKGEKIFKTTQNYGIIEEDFTNSIEIYADTVCFSESITPMWEPIGQRVFKETRIKL